ncbi:hypothetical protein HMPREF0322_00973 [Desulfitobacterium hafniense DP7]|uniref:Uncharacterized protein n=1 Tax=Desulfitobacterium hafniense DP7 TaxID=537010 RepID=G9XJ47_DESHA|nr:hypothetical protein HMPREF0322_00973 [Desulfitobacterium hafniense DP7]
MCYANQFVPNFQESLFPGNPLPISTAFSLLFKGIKNPVGRVDQLFQCITLGADFSPGIRIPGITFYVDNPAVGDLGQEAAGGGTIGSADIAVGLRHLMDTSLYLKRIVILKIHLILSEFAGKFTLLGAWKVIMWFITIMIPLKCQFPHRLQ